MKDPLFSSFSIGQLEISNRLIRSACAERSANPDGSVSPVLEELYTELAVGGAGLVVTGYAFVESSGRCGARQLGIHHDSMIPGLTGLCNRFHRASPGARLFIQLVHGGRQSKPYLVPEIVAPSAVPLAGIKPRPLRHREILRIIKSFAEAGGRAKEAGFDGVQIHGAHGFLISQFNSPHTNRREDIWGGIPENRRRFFLEIIKETRKITGDDFPIIAKVNGSDFLENRGLNLEEVIPMIAAAKEAGLDGVEISGGMADTPPELSAIRGPIRRRSQEAYLLPWARSIKNAVDMPVITVGGVRSARIARDIITRQEAHGIAMCRPFIREKDIPLRWKNGQLRSACISCGGCSIDTGGPTRCVLSKNKDEPIDE